MVRIPVYIQKIEKYVGRPPVVEALEFTGWPTAEILWKWTNGRVFFVPDEVHHTFRTPYPSLDRKAFLVVSTPEGDKRADQGDYLVKDVLLDTLWIFTQSDFKETYFFVPGWERVESV